jgi:hypothetical protein
MLDLILSHDQIYGKWLEMGGGLDNALVLTKQQLKGFEELVCSDSGWQNLLEIASRGRTQDAWLAADWPTGFDELVLCVPLCKLVDWECSKCTVGSRQNDFSCASDNSLFGLIGVLVERQDRQALLKHLKKIEIMLEDKNYFWDISSIELVTIPINKI